MQTVSNESINSKPDGDKLDVDKLKNVPVGFKKLSDSTDNNVVKNHHGIPYY